SADLEALADDAGEFHFTDVPPGEVTVSAFHSGWRGARIALGRLDASRRDLELVLTLGSTIAGRVLDADGAPAKRAGVWVQSPGGEGEILSADADGRFRVSGLDDGAFRVTAWDELDASREIAIAFHAPAGTLDLELTLAAPGSLALALRGER